MEFDRNAAARSVGHVLQLHEFGGVDGHAHDEPDPHAGPRCIRCGKSWCYSCDPVGPRGGCQVGYGSTRNAVKWFVLRVADKATRVVHAVRRELQK